MARRAGWIGVAAVACAVVAACGSDRGGKQELSAADQAFAETIKLRAQDLPQGWVPALGTVAGQGGGEAVDRVFDACLAADRDAATPTGDASSAVFRLGALMVTSRVTIAESEQAARAELAALRGARAAFCLKEAVEIANREIEVVPTSVDQTTTTMFVRGVAVEAIESAEPRGVASVALRARVDLQTVSGIADALTSDRIFFLRGRALVGATFTSPASFPADLQRRVLSTLASRASRS